MHSTVSIKVKLRTRDFLEFHSKSFVPEFYLHFTLRVLILAGTYFGG